MNAKTIKHAIKSFAVALKTKNIVPIEHRVDEGNILQGHVALITGGSGGIGYAIAKSFLESDCKVIIAGTNENKLKQCVEKLGEGAEYIVLNLNEVSKMPEKIEKASRMFGKIDVLVNSAGIHSTRSMTDFFNTTEEEFNNILDINLKGTYFVSQAIASTLVKGTIKQSPYQTSTTVNEEEKARILFSGAGVYTIFESNECKFEFSAQREFLRKGSECSLSCEAHCTCEYRSD